jgi:hypothetical protein
MRENRLLNRAIACASSWYRGHARTTCAQLVPSSSRLELCLVYARHPCRPIRAQSQYSQRGRSAHLRTHRRWDSANAYGVERNLEQTTSIVWHGTSPGYANDGANRHERLIRHANEPTKERIKKTVKKLMNASVKAETGKEKEAERASPCECTPSSVASTPDTSTCCPLNSTHGLTAAFAGATPPLHTSDTTVLLSSSVGPTPSKLLHRRQQRKKDVSEQGATSGDNIDQIGT